MIKTKNKYKIKKSLMFLQKNYLSFPKNEKELKSLEAITFFSFLHYLLKERVKVVLLNKLTKALKTQFLRVIPDLSFSILDSNPITKSSFYTSTSLCKNTSIFQRSRNYSSSRGTYYNKFNTNAPISDKQKVYFEKQLQRNDLSDSQRQFFLKGLENGTGSLDYPKEDYPTKIISKDNLSEDNIDFIFEIDKSISLLKESINTLVHHCNKWINHLETIKEMKKDDIIIPHPEESIVPSKKENLIVNPKSKTKSKKAKDREIESSKTDEFDY